MDGLNAEEEQSLMAVEITKYKSLHSTDEEKRVRDQLSDKERCARDLASRKGPSSWPNALPVRR